MSDEAANMPCGFLQGHCYKVVLLALAGLVALEYSFGVLYEESRRMNEAYFTFNLTVPAAGGAASRSVLHYGAGNNETDDYYASANMTMIALLSANASDPFDLDLLVDRTTNATLNHTRKMPMCPIVSPLLGTRAPLLSLSDRLSIFNGLRNFQSAGRMYRKRWSRCSPLKIGTQRSWVPEAGTIRRIARPTTKWPS